MKLKNILLASAFVALAPALANAQEVSASANIGVSSDYVWRGVSQTSGRAQVFGGVDASAGTFYVGAWASNVDWQPDAELEVDFYAGYKPVLGPVTLDLGAAIYTYPQDRALNVVEYKAGASVTAPGDVVFGLTYYYSPEVGKGGPSSTYGELGVSAPIPGAKVGPFALAVAGSYGVYNYSSPSWTDYNNYKLALSGTTENGWGVEVGYTDTDVSAPALHGIYDGRGYATLKRTF